ncbi:MAG: cupin domain-containing protein [Candidatus Binataceae bacterium]
MKRVIVACIAAALLATVGRARAQTAQDGSVEHLLMRQALSDQSGTDVVIVSVDYPPGGATEPHDHPGYVYAYVLDGAVVSKVDDQPQQTYTKGHMWSELPGQHHIVSKNASATEPAKLLVFFIVPHGEKKLITFLPAH